MIRSLLAFGGAVIVAGCAAPDAASYPSLAPRPAETRSFAEPAAPAPEPVVADPALDARIASAGRAMADAAAAFDRGAATAERAAKSAAGARAGSERWLDAQTKLAELDSLRGTYLDAVDALEELAAKRAAALAPAYPALERALEAGRAAIQAQQARIDTIAGSLATA